jgi:PadR family transcriptional regulator, regulatory protein PadR
MSAPVPRLSVTEALILELLRGNEMYGLQLVQASGGTLKRGTVYVTLGRMQEKGFVESRPEVRRAGVSGLPRRLYRPTGLGLRVLDAWDLLRKAVAWEGAS